MTESQTKLFGLIFLSVILITGLLALYSLGKRNEEREAVEHVVTDVKPSYTFKVYSGTAGTYYVEQVQIKNDTIYVLTQNGRVIGTLPKDFQFEK